MEKGYVLIIVINWGLCSNNDNYDWGLCSINNNCIRSSVDWGLCSNNCNKSSYKWGLWGLSCFKLWSPIYNITQSVYYRSTYLRLIVEDSHNSRDGKRAEISKDLRTAASAEASSVAASELWVARMICHVQWLCWTLRSHRMFGKNRAGLVYHASSNMSLLFKGVNLQTPLFSSTNGGIQNLGYSLEVTIVGRFFFCKKWASRNGQWENTNNFLSMTPGGEFLGTPLNLPQLSVQQVGQIRKPAMAPSHWSYGKSIEHGTNVSVPTWSQASICH